MSEIQFDHHVWLPVSAWFGPGLMRPSQFLQKCETVFHEKIGDFAIRPVVQSPWHSHRVSLQRKRRKHWNLPFAALSLPYFDKKYGCVKIEKSGSF